jgi:hypothetical protein
MNEFLLSDQTQRVSGQRAVFLFGFAENQRDNLTPVQLPT